MAVGDLLNMSTINTPVKDYPQISDSSILYSLFRH